jgi:hypothetical protein
MENPTVKHGYGVTEKVLKDLIEQVVRARAPERFGVLDFVDHASLSHEEREDLRGLLADELIESGVGADGEPNDRGRIVEAAIDWLGHH